MHISMDSVTKTFQRADDQPLTVLRDFSMDLSSGAVARLRGRSGSGKSTLFNLIAGLLLPDQGSIKLGNTVVSELREGARDRFRARNIGYVFQTFNLLSPITVLQNVFLPGMLCGVGDSDDPKTAERILGELGLASEVSKHPYQLSVGQRQRVAVARALLRAPDVLIADEPTASLDAESSELVRAAILDLASRGTTILLATHDPLFDDVEPDLEVDLEGGE